MDIAQNERALLSCMCTHAAAPPSHQEGALRGSKGTGVMELRSRREEMCLGFKKPQEVSLLNVVELAGSWMLAAFCKIWQNQKYFINSF